MLEYNSDFDDDTNNLAYLRKKRDFITGNLTRIRSHIDKLDLDNISKKNFLELQRRLYNLNPLIGEFNSIQERIEVLADNLKREQIERDTFESEYYDLCSTIEEILEKFASLQNNELRGDQSRIVEQNIVAQNIPSQLQLPVINIETFNGDYNKWVEFRDCFQAIVGKNAALSGVQKLCHLRKSLGRDVLKTIESLPLTDANFEVAWNALKKRYERGKLIVETHIRKIINFPCLTKESSKDLRNLYDTVNNNLQALKILGQPIDKWDAILVPIITDKLDPKLRREYDSFYINEMEKNPNDNSSPTIDSLLNMINHRCELLERGEKDKFESFKPQSKPLRNTYSAHVPSSLLSTSSMSCYFCKQDHTIYKCKEFLKLGISERIHEIKRRKFCLNCLRPHENLGHCPSAPCRKCGKYHNTLLHLEKDSRSVNAAPKREDLPESSAGESDDLHHGTVTIATTLATKNIEKDVSLIASTQVLLSTAIVYVKDSQGQTREIRALLDSGSMTNFITTRVFNMLGLEAVPINHSIMGVGQVVSDIKYRTNISISSKDGSFYSNISCLILPQITGNIPQISFDTSKLNIPSNVKLADEQFNISRPIDLLLGSGVFWNLLKGATLQIKHCSISLQETKLGWILAGELSNPSSRSITCINILTLDDQVRKFWETEEIISNVNPSDTDLFCETHFMQTHTRDNDGRFTVKIPFKENFGELGHSKELALKRFLMLEKRLVKNESLYREYTKFMDEYEAMNHMKEIPNSLIQNDEELNYYIPHHAIIRESSCTTKLRVVFDASMKSASGLSLNDVQHVGPSIQNDLFNILLEFRLFKYVVSADISKMYRMIAINEQDRSFHRIFWRKNPSCEIKCYELNTVTYGTASAPFLAIRCLQQLSLEHETKYTGASEAIKNNFYVDDFLYGADSESEILNIQHDITTILQSGGFNLRKWLCNKPDLINKFLLNDDLEVNVLKLGENEASKTLGISWNPQSDTIQYSSSNLNCNTILITKRSILSQVSQIFDPLGLLGPIIIVAKILLQSLWQASVGWDEQIPNSLELQWQRFYENLIHLENLKITRHVTTHDRIAIELHGFSDASERAYGACVYVRSKLPNGTYISRLLCAKSRVCPLKKLSLPRLELSSALLLAKLIEKVKNTFKLDIERIYLWSDSTITLSWIRASPTKWKTFVANRVSEIQRLSNVEEWSHVRSAENPADVISRGTTVLELTNNELWWTGPSWLTQGNIPTFTVSLPTENLPEQKLITLTAIENNFNIFNRVSNLFTLQRIMAYCLRFIKNCKIEARSLRSSGNLTNSEIQNSLTVLIKLSQQESFTQEYSDLTKKRSIKRKSCLLALNPFLDENNLIRVGGRLKHSDYPFDKKYPIILAKDHTLTKLIVKWEHIRLCHCAPTALLSSIRERYWPIRAKNLVKGIVRNCVTCFKANPKTPEYLMGDLPKSRVTPSLPFFNVGTDYAGPFLLKDRVTRNARLVKGYVCLFVCLVTKAIHLELVSDLTTACFLAAFKRFIGRRGKPLNVYSDNATNFLGASNELKEFYHFLKNNSNAITDELSKENITWHFIPAKTPSFGGIWEAGIKSVKSHLKRVVGTANLVFEDFLTVLIQIEAVVNSRPLCPLSTEPDITPLTPGHFLIGRSLVALPEQEYINIPENRLRRYQRLQMLVQHFWKRWYKEYVSELQVRVRWKTKTDLTNLIKPGKVVLLKEDDVPAMKWPLGVITELHPGNDDVIRAVTVRSAGRNLRRGVTKICVLPEE